MSREMQEAKAKLMRFQGGTKTLSGVRLLTGHLCCILGKKKSGHVLPMSLKSG